MLSNRYALLAGFVSLFLAGLGSCSKVKEEVNERLLAKLTTTVQVSESQTMTVTIAANSPGFAGAPTDTTSPTRKFGATTAEGLKSLQVYFERIFICTEETDHFPDDGAKSSNRCIMLYKGNELSQYALDGAGRINPEEIAGLADVLRKDTASQFTDLMSAESRAALTSDVTLGSKHIGSYKYAYANWYHPMRLKAEIDLGNGVVLHTHDGVTSWRNDGDYNGNPMEMLTLASQPFTEGTADEAVVIGWPSNSFILQTPLEITHADLVKNTQFAIDFVFNPEGLIKGKGPEGMGLEISLADQSVEPGSAEPPPSGFVVPEIDFSPIPHRSDQTISKEVYAFDVTGRTGGSPENPNGDPNPYRVRIELYFANEDPNKGVVGVGTKSLFLPESIEGMAEFPITYAAVTGSDGMLELKLKGPNGKGLGNAVISQFKRSSTPGETVSATFHCQAETLGNIRLHGCTDKKSISGTLVAVTAVGK